MKLFKLLLALFCSTTIVNAQLIKNSFGESWATNEKIHKDTADASKREPGWRYGFTVEFEFVAGLEKVNKTSYLTQLEKIVVRKERGYFHQYFSEKTGKYYQCAKLNNLCETTELNDITIVAIWEYNGKEYRSGAVQMTNRRDDKSYLKKPVSVTPPGGGAIPHDAVRSGAAKVVNIEVISWSFNTTDAIMEIIRNSK